MRSIAFILLGLTSLGFAQDAELLDLALVPPLINIQPGPEYDEAVRPGNMVLGMDRTPKGRLWAAWVGNGDSPNGFFMLATSDDKGKTWSKPRLVIDPQDGVFKGQEYTRRALVGNLWTDPLGRLWCLDFPRNGGQKNQGLRAFKLRSSCQKLEKPTPKSSVEMR